MKKYKVIVLFIVLVIVLAAVDQCAKLVIDNYYEADDEALMQVRDCFHIHHRIHRSTLFDDICRGCGRTAMEVANWVFMTEEEKREVWIRIKAQGYPRRNN